MLTSKQEFGRKAEAIAARRLKKSGYKIIDRNYRTRIGEIDIIARDGDTLAFIEVKARQSTRFGTPKLAVTPAKQRKISMVALQYLKAAGLSGAKARFDVVSVAGVAYRPHIEIVKNAFELAYK